MYFDLFLCPHTPFWQFNKSRLLHFKTSFESFLVQYLSNSLLPWFCFSKELIKFWCLLSLPFMRCWFRWCQSIKRSLPQLCGGLKAAAIARGCQRIKLRHQKPRNYQLCSFAWHFCALFFITVMGYNFRHFTILWSNMLDFQASKLTWR